MSKIIFIIILAFNNSNLIGQKRNAIWCFGDSALIDFSDTSNISLNKSMVKSRGSSASIADSNGNLLFYLSYDPTVLMSGTDPVKAFNFNSSLLMNGDSMKGGGWYNEITILPWPGSDSLYYMFYIGVLLDYGIYYSIIDMSANGGLGEVIQKNIQLQNFKMVDCLKSIKHGNGRDWWLIFRKSDFPSSANNIYYTYLITPNGISNLITQSVGSLNSTNLGQITFNNQGNRMSFINYKGLIELYDFDRCSGIISNPITIEQENMQAKHCWSSEFSPLGNVYYVTSTASAASDSAYLVQYDLLSPIINQSADTLWRTPFMVNIGHLKLAPDNKIYITTNYNGGYPYQDSVFNYINMNLSMINLPDSLSSTSNFQPFSFSLGGARSYFGLPNNPNYDLGPLVGSVCDTLVGDYEINIYNSTSPELFVYFDFGWQTAFINANSLKGKTYRLSIYDLLGKEIFVEFGKINSSYFTKNLNCSAFSKGMYVVVFQTDKEKLVKRFVVE